MRLAKKLHPITGRNTYCGPAAVSAIAGVTSDMAAALFREYTERAQCRWVFDNETSVVLASLGYRMLRQDSFKKGERPTLNRWLDKRENFDAVYLVNVTSHYVIVCGRTFADSSRRRGCNVADMPKPRARVIQSWLIEKRQPIGDLPQRVARRADQRKTAASAMAKARRIAKRDGVEIESCREAYGSDSTGYNVWPPAQIADTYLDPHDGDHFAHDADEVLERVKRYADLIART